MELKNKVTVGNKTFAYVKVKDLKVSKNNVRPEQTPEEREEIKAELAQSIKELGLQQLPVVTPNGEVFIGGRRTVAFQELGEEWMLAEIREATPFEQMIASYTENFHRKSPDYMNEGELFKRMCVEGGVSENELAKTLGVSQDYINSRTRIFEKLKNTANGIITFELARIIASVPEEDKREELVKMASEGMKTQELKKIIATTNAVKCLIDGEDENIQKKAKKKFEDQYFTKDLNISEVKWQLEEWTGDSHTIGEGRIWWDQKGIKSKEEAILWFKKHGGKHLEDKKGSLGEWDKEKEKMESEGR